MEQTIPSIGEYLAQKRKDKGLSLEEISETTKIKIRILENVESNRFEEFPAPGYAKAIINSYAKAINAQNTKLQQMIDTRFATKQVLNARFSSVQPKKMLIPTNLFWMILLIILVIIIIFTAIKMTQSGILKSPFKRVKQQVEKVKKEINTENESPKITKTKAEIQKEEKVLGKISIKPKMFQEAEKIEREKMIREKDASLNKTALRDTTNYINKLLFKREKNPFLK